MAAEYLQRMGARMAQRRRELGLTQEEVARQLPGTIAGGQVSKWERGLHRPKDDVLEAVARVLDVDVSYFLAAPAEKRNGTPDLLASGIDPLGAQLLRVEAKLDLALKALGVRFESTEEERPVPDAIPDLPTAPRRGLRDAS